MPPKATTKKAPPAAAAAAPAAAAKPPPPAPVSSFYTAYPYNFTDKYIDKKNGKHWIDVVLQMEGCNELPRVRVVNSTTLSITAHLNKLAFVNLAEGVGMPENSARAAAYTSIAQKFAKSKQYNNDDDGDTFTGEPQIIKIPDNIKVKTDTPNIEHHPFSNGCKQRKGRTEHKQYSSVLIVQLEVDMPWVDHTKKIKKGECINLLGLSQSSEESLPQRGKRGGGGGYGGGGFGGGGYGGGGGKRDKLNPVEEEYEKEE